MAPEGAELCSGPETSTSNELLLVQDSGTERRQKVGSKYWVFIPFPSGYPPFVAFFLGSDTKLTVGLLL